MKDYGQEAVEEILKFMSDKDGQIVVIVAGYKEEMQEFLKSNPGLDFAEITKQRSQDLVKKMNNPENYNFTIEELRLLPKSLFEHFKFRD